MSSIVGLLLLWAGWGLLMGFSHCIGMCGIFVLSCSGGRRAGPELVLRNMLFHSGRLLTFILLGAAAGSIGSLAGLATRFSAAQAWVSFLTGILLALLSLGQFGILPRLRIPEPDVLGLGGGWGRRIYSNLLRSQSRWQPILLGIVIGFLPCGLIYTAVIAAAGTLSPGKGAAVMVAFGLGTIPGLLTLGMGSGWLLSRLRSSRVKLNFQHAAACVMLLMSALFIYRSWPGLHL